MKKQISAAAVSLLLSTGSAFCQSEARQQTATTQHNTMLIRRINVDPGKDTIQKIECNVGCTDPKELEFADKQANPETHAKLLRELDYADPTPTARCKISSEQSTAEIDLLIQGPDLPELTRTMVLTLTARRGKKLHAPFVGVCLQ